MATELGIEIELCGRVLVLPCAIGQNVNRVEVIDLLLLYQYALSLVGMYKKRFQALHFRSLFECF